MVTYAVVIRNQDNFMDCGTTIGITHDINDAKNYVRKAYETCIAQVTADHSMEFTKHLIDDDHKYAELEWISGESHTVFTSDIFITETFDI